MTIARGTGSPSHGAATHGNSVTIDSTSTNLIVFFENDFSTADAPTENKSNGAATALTSRGSTSPKSTMYYWLNPTVGSSHTFDALTDAYGIFVASYSGVATSSAFDKETGSANASTSSSIKPGAADATNDSSLYIIGIGGDVGGTSLGCDTSFNNLDTLNYSVGVSWLGGLFDRIVSGTHSSLDPTVSWTGGADTRTAEMAIFAPAVGGGGGFAYSFGGCFG